VIPDTPPAWGAVRTTVERATRFHTVPDDLATTVGARRCKCMDGALETVERVRALRSDHLERLVVIVSADITFRHQVISMADTIYFVISPQAIRSPALPAGSLFMSSALAWTTNAVPPPEKTE
jgi:hypothetical protein